MVTQNKNKPNPRMATHDEGLSSWCVDCGGTGLRDLGGFHPWGEPVMVECDCGAADIERGEPSQQKSVST